MTLWTKDRAISAWLNVSEKPGWRRTLAIIITHSGDVVFPLGGMGLLVAFGSPAWKMRALMLFLADTITFIVAHMIKFSTRRPRPKGKWGRIYRITDPHSFPSGHASRGGALAAMGLVVGPVWFGILVAVWGMLLALSRVLMGVHYVSDSVAGFVLGVCIVGLIMLLVF